MVTRPRPTSLRLHRAHPPPLLYPGHPIPMQPRLSELLGKAVKKVDDCIGDAVAKATAELKNGEVRAGCSWRLLRAALLPSR